MTGDKETDRLVSLSQDQLVFLSGILRRIPVNHIPEGRPREVFADTAAEIESAMWQARGADYAMALAIRATFRERIRAGEYPEIVTSDKPACPQCGAGPDDITWPGDAPLYGEDRWACGTCGHQWATEPQETPQETRP